MKIDKTYYYENNVKHFTKFRSVIDKKINRILLVSLLWTSLDILRPTTGVNNSTNRYDRFEIYLIVTYTNAE